MPSIQKHSSGHSTTSSRDSESSRRSSDSYASSQSTALTSVLIGYSPRMLEKTAAAAQSSTQPSTPTPMASPRSVTYAQGVRGGHEVPQFQTPCYDDLSPSTRCCPRASTDTYASSNDDEDEAERQAAYAEQLADGDASYGYDPADLTPYASGYQHRYSGVDDGDDEELVIPPLPEYRHEIVDSTVRPTTPHGFAQLFPSVDRMSIRHDEFTTDGNMNLRVDMTVPGGTTASGGRRRPTSYQLFHLRMYDLARREFSLRRYCRDSGREVCNAKLVYDEASTAGSRSRRSSYGGSREPMTLPRSMTTALRSLGSSSKPSFRRMQAAGSNVLGSHWRPGSPSAHHDGKTKDHGRQSLARSTSSFSSLFDRRSRDGADVRVPAARPRPTDTVKLEFSNYARVDVTYRAGIDYSYSYSSSSSSSSSSNSSSSHHNGHNGHNSHNSHNSHAGPSTTTTAYYDFEWWGHRYTWKRVSERHLPGMVQFHLLQDYDAGVDEADVPVVAHIVPEPRSPNQEAADETAGGWVPPCHMWISERSVLEAMTDVADVIMATGLVALVDDCIRDRWPTADVRRARERASALRRARSSSSSSHSSSSHSSSSGSGSGGHNNNSGPRALMHLFHRRGSSTSSSPHASSPLRNAQPISAY